MPEVHYGPICFHRIGSTSNGFRFRFFNDTGIAIRLRCCGVHDNAFFTSDFEPEDALHLDSLAGGMRVVMAWDALGYDLVSAKRLNIDKHGRFRVTQNVVKEQQYDEGGSVVEVQKFVGFDELGVIEDEAEF